MIEKNHIRSVELLIDNQMLTQEMLANKTKVNYLIYFVLSILI